MTRCEKRLIKLYYDILKQINKNIDYKQSN